MRTHAKRPNEDAARRASARGFTLIELMIVVVIIGILAAVAVPNFIALLGRAKEGGTKNNMHTFQLASEDFAVQNTGAYAGTADEVAALVPGSTTTFRNTFSHLPGVGEAWEDRVTFGAPSTPVSGITSYADSVTTTYNIKGFGKTNILPLVLSAGQ